MTDYDVWLTTPPDPSDAFFAGNCEECGEQTYDGDDSVVLEHIRYCEDCGNAVRAETEAREQSGIGEYSTEELIAELLQRGTQLFEVTGKDAITLYDEQSRVVAYVKSQARIIVKYG